MSTTIKNRSKLLKLTQVSVLTAIIIIMAFTPLGYLRTGTIVITFLAIPVVIGAMVCGPACGAILGGVFGITSFIQCFGLDPFGTFLFGLNPVYTFITCLIPRILMGWFAGMIFKSLYKHDKTKLISFGIASLSGALLNTIMFMTCLIMFFWKNSSFIEAMKNAEFPVNSILAFVVAFVLLNCLVEAGVCLITGTLISKALVHFIPVEKAGQTA